MPTLHHYWEQKLTGDDIRGWIALALGAAGTALSVYNMILAKKKDRRQLEISAGTSMIVMDNGDWGPDFLTIKATNTGTRPVTVTSLSIELPNGGSLLSLHKPTILGVQDSPLPMTLSDGQSAEVHFFRPDVISQLKKAHKHGASRSKPFAQDSAGKRHYGEPLNIRD